MTAVHNLQGMTVFAPDIHLWTGRRKLRAEDLGLHADSEMERVVSLGAKRTCDPAKLRVFNTLRERAYRACRQAGLPFLGAYAVPNDKVEELRQRLEELRGEFNRERQDFLDNYEALVQEWLAENHQYRRALERAVTPLSVVSNQLRYGYGTFEVQADSLGGDAPEVAEALGESLFDDVVKSAQEVWDRRIDQKDEMSRKGLNALKRLRDKVDSLSFLDARSNNIVAAIDEVLTSLPKTGPIKNRDFLLISMLVSQLRSKKNFESLLETMRNAQQTGLLVPENVATSPAWGWNAHAEAPPPETAADDSDEAEVAAPTGLRPTGTSLYW